MEVPAWVPLRYILYPATPTLSVEAVHEKEAVEEVITPSERPVGTVGGVVSAGGGFCTFTVIAAEIVWLPDVSFARAVT